jgi:hypothetical protein
MALLIRDRSHALRGYAARDARRPLQSRTQSVRRGIPTQSVGTIGCLAYCGNSRLSITRFTASSPSMISWQQRPALRRGYEVGEVMSDGSG